MKQTFYVLVKYIFSVIRFIEYVLKYFKRNNFKN